MSTFLGKFLYLGIHLYKVVEGNIGHNTISLQNVLTNDYARHYNGIVENTPYSNDELFLYDSSFHAHQVDNKIKLFCSNHGITSFCITDVNGFFSIMDSSLCNTNAINNEFELFTRSDICVKENFVSENDRERKVVAFGSSSTEIFDYIFGDNQDYIPCWASGWSARGLRKIKSGITPYSDILNKISKNSIILLHFGPVDIDFNLQYKCETSGFYRINDFIKEMIDGVLSFRRLLIHELGFKNVYAIFTAPTVPLEQKYWVEHLGIHSQFSSQMRAKMLWDFALSVSSVMPTINCLPDIAESEQNPICAKEYMREYNDHHIDFVAAQELVFTRLKEYIPDILPAKKEKHAKLYPHLYFDARDAFRLNKPRPRTCR